jgi:hypothetical protein
MTAPITPPSEPANDVVTIRAAAGFLGVFTLAALGCATWLEAVGNGSPVAWTLVGTGLGALAMLATSRLGGTRPQ